MKKCKDKLYAPLPVMLSCPSKPVFGTCQLSCRQSPSHPRGVQVLCAVAALPETTKTLQIPPCLVLLLSLSLPPLLLLLLLLLLNSVSPASSLPFAAHLRGPAQAEEEAAQARAEGAWHRWQEAAAEAGAVALQGHASVSAEAKGEIRGAGGEGWRNQMPHCPSLSQLLCAACCCSYDLMVRLQLGIRYSVGLSNWQQQQ